MAERVVNLSDKPRAVVTLQLGGRSFRIARVVNAVRKLYGEFLEQAGELVQKAAAAEALESGVAAAGPEEQTRALRRVQEITAEVESFAARKTDVLLRCIELLLTKNDLAFDRDWWIDNGDETDYQTFIVEALMKDAPQKKTAAGAA